jgi:hypothetical protein
MSKPNRETRLREGEQRLREWGLPDDASVASLRDSIGRDPAADLAVAARLGAHAEVASADVLLALEASSRDKLVRKEVRRSLYRLQQRGIPVAHVAPAAPAALTPPPALEGYLSAVDGRGDQLVWLVKPRPGALLHLFAVTNDPEGLREVDLTETTRKALRAARQELLQRHELRMVEADWQYCDFLIDRAFRWASAKGTAISGDYRGFRAQLSKDPVTERTPLIFSVLDAEAVRRQPGLLADSGTLLEEKEFRTWFFEPDAVKSYIEEMRQIRDSPLVLNAAQQQERFRALAEHAVEELFGGERRASWVRRLEEMAYFLHATGRVEQAKRAVAAALALAESTRGGRDIPLCEQLARSSLAAFWQIEEQRRQEDSRSSLIVTPQQAAREMDRRR